MISKELFLNILERLEKLNKKISNVDYALRDLSPDFGGLYVSETTDITVDILQAIFNDKGEWLAYLIYERDWLKSFKIGNVLIDDTPIDLTTWEKVYDFLIAMMKEEAI